MQYTNHDNRQQFAKVRAAVESVPNDPSTGTAWRDEPLEIAKPDLPAQKKGKNSSPSLL